MTRIELGFYDNFQTAFNNSQLLWRQDHETHNGTTGSSASKFFKGLAKEAAESRICAGIHYRSYLVAGSAQADAELIIERTESDCSQ